MTHKKRDYTSLPHSKIQAFNVETAAIAPGANPRRPAWHSQEA
jgi:hypothetical protein